MDTEHPAKQAIETILQEETFSTREVESTWVPRDPDAWWLDWGDDPAGPDIDFSLLGQTFELLLWGAVGALAVLIVRYLWRAAQNYRKPMPLSRRQTVASPVLSALESAAASRALPVNPAQAAWALWQQGEERAALSLLYRASLQVLHERDGLPLHDSATEGECLRQIQQVVPAQLSAYFSRLTLAWQNIAYADQAPDQQLMKNLCAQWPDYFASQEQRATE